MSEFSGIKTEQTMDQSITYGLVTWIKSGLSLSMIAEPFISGKSRVREIWLYSGKVNPSVWWILYPNASFGRSFLGVLESTVSTSTSSPAFDRNLSISLNRLAYPETWVNGVGSTIRQILRGGLRFRGGASFDWADCLSSVALPGVVPCVESMGVWKA